MTAANTNAGAAPIASGAQSGEVQVNPIETRKLADLKPYPRNARTHSPEQIDLLCRLLKKYGATQPAVVDENNMILVGHARTTAARKIGWTDFPVVVMRGLSDAEKSVYVIADNQSAALAGWNEDILRVEMSELQISNFDLSLTGFLDVDALSNFIRGGTLDGEPPPGELDDANRAALLELVNITIADPTHKVERGDHYVLSKRHHLLCASVIEGWRQWAPLLTDTALFCPYPGVFVPFATKAKKHALIMVQPDAYIAGHILDRFAEASGGEQEIEKMVQQ